ncbi:Sjogren's syndrome/scleroderma autoantigen 1 family protein [Halorussus sp. MSC15.2]|uniref:Sjogren's syndrome/scleroderma autoantigen 1 family protein n=1 Tax=Halorussus sp. MSC15.2 TaxID=2283638 RepID=UPI0013D302E0|nr:Sjogren's syndrome/scleroderma autoantigen 1 family protein [Halorussus sp. MSC15.2]NEU59094.1 hypothetical protein [Halorussus sp. MSC15.2]
MSSDDSEFDKEAEREKLREKYGDEEQDRENTRRMSELLLQGATMTGKHCDNCGDPIFRYDGQEFCPTCQHEARAQAEGQNGDQSEQAQQSTETPAQAEANADRNQQTAETADRPATDDPDDEPYVEINDVRVADQHADRSDLRRPPSQTDDRRDGQSRDASNRDAPTRDASTRNAVSQRPTDERRSARDRSPANASGHRHAHGATSADRDDLGTAREALVRKLSSLAREAETTDDVARARDLLAATREAAEALAALDRANR